MQPKVTIIVPVKDNLDITKVCLDTLRLYTPEGFQLIVIDDGSQPETSEYLSNLPSIDYIRNETSLGWCVAINQGIKLAKANLIVFANNDVVVTPQWFEKMERHINNPKHNVGILGTVSNQVDGYQHIDFNKEGITFQKADVVTFFFVMIKRELIDNIGVLDERFGLGGQDDADYSIRARKAGYSVGIARDTFVYHYGSASFRNILKNNIQDSKNYSESRIDLLRDKYRDTFDAGIKKRIMICIPNCGHIVPELATLLINWSHDPRWMLKIYMPKGLFPLDNARNHCVTKFLQSDCDLLLWIDDDIIPPPNTLERFLVADKDIIGAVAFAMKYENNQAFPYPVTLRYNEDKKYVAYYGKGLERVDATGGACLLYKRKVYEAIERPYEFQYYRNGTLSLTCDFSIFQKAEKLGFELWIDFDLICDHVKEISIKSIQNTLLQEQNKLSPRNINNEEMV